MFEGAESGSGRGGCRSAKAWCLRWARALLAVAVIQFGAMDAMHAQDIASGRDFQFDIPSQPLAPALREYSKITGLEVFYDGSLAVGRRSAAVHGAFAPMRALQALLRGTGYVARTTEIADTVTIVSAPSVAPLQAMFDRYQFYFATLQARVSETLCQDEEAAASGEEVRLRFWLDPSGMVSNAEMIGMDRDYGRQRAVASKIKGLRIGTAPPPGLPQPVTMIVYPPSAGEAAECSPAGNRQALQSKSWAPR